MVYNDRIQVHAKMEGFIMHHGHHGRHHQPEMTAGQLALAMIPGIIITSGLTALMAAKAYEIIRLANAKGKQIKAE
jgi:hypothetical protein